MSVLAPVHSLPHVAALVDSRPVLAVLDIDAPLQPVLNQAVEAAATLAAPLRVVVLYTRLGFTTDAAIAARVARRLRSQRQRVTAAVADAACGYDLGNIQIDLVPFARLPPGNRRRQAARAAAAQARRVATSLVVVAPELRAVEGGDGGQPR